MKSQRAAALIGVVFAVFLMQLLGALAGTFASLAVGSVVAGAAAMVTRQSGFRPITLIALIVVASALGVLLPFVASGNATLWLSPVISLVVIVAFNLRKQLPEQACIICGKIIRDLVFKCPRCLKPVCDGEECWMYSYLRCRRCENDGVPILLEKRPWWIAHFGQPLSKGVCQLCQTDAARVELFGCPQCGHGQCQGCWDQANGQCSGCGWILPGLPEQLMNYLHVGP